MDHNSNNTDEKFEKNIDLMKLEAKIIEQEHRPFRVICTFFETRSESKNNPKRKAATIALIYNLFFSPSTFAVGGTLVGIITLTFLVIQTHAMQKQNVLIQESNYAMQLFEVIPRLYDTKDKKRTKGLHSRPVRRSALEFFINIKKSQGYTNYDLSGARLDGVNLKNLDLRGVSFVGANLADCDFNGSNLSGTDFTKANLWGAKLNEVIGLNKAILSETIMKDVLWPKNFTQEDAHKKGAKIDIQNGSNNLLNTD